MFGHRYDVPVVLTDLSPSEALLQSFDNLQRLDAVLTDVFTRISTRIQSERGKLAAVQARITSASEKVNQLSTNANRVTTIFSTNKYPAPKLLPDFQRIFHLDLGAENNHTGTNQTNSTSDSEVASASTTSGAVSVSGDGFFPNPHRLLSPSAPVHPQLSLSQRLESSSPADTSLLFVKFSQRRVSRTEKEMNPDEQAEGLGRLPAYLPSLSSILLFNSEENPYKAYVTINNLEGVGGEDRVSGDSGPSAAPKSLIDGVDLPTFAGFQFEYKPLLGELPTFTLPTNLPLGKLADISFGVETTQSIAPSVGFAALPSFDLLALPVPARPAQPQSAVPSSSSNNTYNPQITNNNISTPNSVPPSDTSGPTTILGQTSNIPQPPPIDIPAPPPFSPSAPPSAVSTSTTIEASSSSSDSSDGGRNALLEAIRNRKNVKLRKTVAGGGVDGSTTGAGSGAGAGAGAGGKEKAGTTGKSSVDVPGGDMMAALRERLARRHNVISGKNQDEIVKPTAPPSSVASNQSSAASTAAPGASLQRRLSKLPRLNDSSKDVPVPGTKEGAEDGAGADGVRTDSLGADSSTSRSATSGPKMSQVVMDAYMAAHKKKLAHDDEEEW